MRQPAAGCDPSFTRLLLAVVDPGGENPPASLGRPLAEVCRILDVDILYLVTPREAGWVKTGYGPDGERASFPVARLTGIARHVLSQRARLVESRIPSNGGPFHRHQDGWPELEAQSYVAVPIHRGGRTRGVLVLLRIAGRPPFGVPHLVSAELLAEAIGARMDIEERTIAIGRLARTDGLTQLANYRCLRELLPRAFMRASDRGEPLSLVMVDVDNLKHVNDRYGHLAGSEVLRRMGRVLARYVRGDDVVAKYGGDEFVILLPGANRDAAIVVAERVREAVSKEVTGPTPEDRISCSSGIACYPEDGTDYVSLISAADRALFSAKVRGRNVVVSCREEDRRTAA